MGHEMTNSDQMYSVREAPWHLGRGTNVLMLDTAPETRTARIESAGHAFTVEERDVFLRAEEEAARRERIETTFPKIQRGRTFGLAMGHRYTRGVRRWLSQTFGRLLDGMREAPPDR